jgi:hypothetical protein
LFLERVSAACVNLCLDLDVGSYWELFLERFSDRVFRFDEVP